MNVERFSLRLAEPLSTAADTIEHRDGFVVRVEVDGTEGVGEATPLSGWTEGVESCRDALEAVADHDPEAALDALDPEQTPAAAHGVELAVLDARAKAAGVPLCEVLTDDDVDRERVAVNATVGDAPPGDSAESAAESVAAGFDAVKVKVGARSLDEDVARLRAVRNAVGPAVELRADANGAWSHEAARTALEEFAELGVAVVEQPLSAADLSGHVSLRGGPVDVALDESLRAHSVGEVVAAGAADVLVLKPMVLGGPAGAVAVAGRAREAGLGAIVTTTVDAVHARTAAVHVAATLEDPLACGLATAGRLADDLAADPAPVEDGHLRVPQDPGNLGGRA